MEVIDAIATLEKSKIFAGFRKKNPDSYLANAFTMIDSNCAVPEWQIGYYDKDKDMIATFVVGKEIMINPESEVFKEKKIVSPLDMKRIKITLETALENAMECQKKKYPGSLPLKKIIILQNSEDHHIYNITFITQEFKTLNIKISSQDGRVIFDKIHSIFDFQKK